MRIRSVIASALIVLLLVGTSASVALPESDAETEISSGIPTGILDKVVDYEAIAEILTGFVHSDTFFNMVYPTIKENLGWTEYETHKFLSKITITSGDVRNLIEFINALFNGGSLNDLRNTVAKLISGEMNYAEFQSLLAELGAPTYILILVTEDVFDKMVQLLSMNFEEVYNLVTGWIATPDAENYDNLISGNVDVFSDVEYTGSLYIADGTVLNFNGAGTITATGPVMISGTVTLRGNAQIVSVGEDASINLGMIHLAESPTKCTLSVKDGATLTYSTAIPEYGSPTDQELKIRAMIKSNGTLAASGEGSYSITFSNDDEVTPTLDVSLCTAPIFNYFKDVDYFSLGLIDLISSGRGLMLSATDHIRTDLGKTNIGYDAGKIDFKGFHLLASPINDEMSIDELSGSFISGTSVYCLEVPEAEFITTVGDEIQSGCVLDGFSLKKDSEELMAVDGLVMDIEVSKDGTSGEYRLTLESLRYDSLSEQGGRISIEDLAVNSETPASGGAKAWTSIEGFEYSIGDTEIVMNGLLININSNYAGSFELLWKIMDVISGEDIGDLLPEIVKLFLSNSETAVNVQISDLNITNEGKTLSVSGNERSLVLEMSLITSIKSGSTPVKAHAELGLSEGAHIGYTEGTSSDGMNLECVDLSLDLDACLETISLSGEDAARSLWDSLKLDIGGGFSVSGTATSGGIVTSVVSSTDITLGKEIVKFENGAAVFDETAFFEGIVSDITFNGSGPESDRYWAEFTGTTYSTAEGAYVAISSDAEYTSGSELKNYILSETKPPAFSGAFVFDSYNLAYVPYNGTAGTGTLFLTRTYDVNMPSGTVYENVASGTRAVLESCTGSIGWSVNGEFVKGTAATEILVDSPLVASFVISDTKGPEIDSGIAVYHVQEDALILRSADITQDVKNLIIVFPNGDTVSMGADDARKLASNGSAVIYPYCSTFNGPLSADTPDALAESLVGSPCSVFYAEGVTDAKMRILITIADLHPAEKSTEKLSVYLVDSQGRTTRVCSECDSEGRFTFVTDMFGTFVLSDYSPAEENEDSNPLNLAMIGGIAIAAVLATAFGSLVFFRRKM